MQARLVWVSPERAQKGSSPSAIFVPTEYRKLLESHGIEDDERYGWD